MIQLTVLERLKTEISPTMFPNAILFSSGWNDMSITLSLDLQP
jgi:hypothetical protein